MNCHNDSDIGIWAFGPKALATVEGDKSATFANGRNLSILQPYVELDGTIKIIYNDNTIASDKTAMSIVGYGNYVIGSEWIGATLVVGSNAEVFVNHGHGLYAANENSNIIINGGKIVGSNGITMRGGHLKIPRDGNPTILGIADYNEYAPTHPSGQAGNGLFVGNAVLIEATNAGYGYVDPIIESGIFYSKNNTSIGSYSNKTSKSAATGVFERKTKFVSGGMLNRVPTTLEYDYSNGHYSDYDIVADGYMNSAPTMIIKQDIV